MVASFDGGAITSDAGARLLGATDRAIRLVDRFASCFRDFRSPRLIEHDVSTLVGQRVFGLALGYEDLIDHDELRHDPVMAVLAGKLSARRRDCRGSHHHSATQPAPNPTGQITPHAPDTSLRHTKLSARITRNTCPASERIQPAARSAALLLPAHLYAALCAAGG